MDMRQIGETGWGSFFASVLQGGVRRTLLLWFLGLSLVPMTLVSIFGYRNAHCSLYEDAKKSLTSVADIKTAYIQFYFSRVLTDLYDQAQRDTNARFLTALRSAFVDSNNPLSEFVKGFKWATITGNWSTDLKMFRRTYGYYDVFLIDLQGHILFSVAGEDDLGTNLFNGRYSDTHFARASKEALETGHAVFSDFDFYAPSKDAIAGFIISVLVDDDGDKIGLIAFQLPIDQINTITQETAGLGQTGETYLIGADLKVRSDSPPERESSLFTKRVDTEQTQLWHREHIEGQRIGEERSDNLGAEKVILYEGPRGKPVIGLHNNIDIAGVSLGVIVEIEQLEAFASAEQLGFFSSGLVGLTSVIVFMIAVVVAGRIVKPVLHLSEVAGLAAAGEIVVGSMNIDRKDEIGALVRSFVRMNQSVQEMTHTAEQIAEADLTVVVTPRSEKDALGKALANMVENLRDQIRQIVKGADVLAVTASEILTATAQLAASSSEAAVSVSQTMTTVEEVRQTAQVSNLKAEDVSENANQVAQFAQNGMRSVEKTIEGMGQIQGQMESISESIVKLSEQSQSIGEIISTVDDLSEQSNLLAVNAAIEATRAGEEGKGFGVVAEEIKSLAEQSKQATRQVRGILNDIQRATSTAVMASEQGSQAVETGVAQSAMAGESIQDLVVSIEAAAQAAVQIAASNQQQLAGVDQVVGAMESIKVASEQNASSTQQVETVAHNLDEVGQQLKGLVEKYRI
ncbi:MAG: methyl-accepting chemotaxis protein [Candidatus Latescibacteria bacterium]|nr:methyl-accepting chemotaxis protein [Candidatus Latescibacterota bacterium]